jgi:1,4-alpha-glucan branching enzyme
VWAPHATDVAVALQDGEHWDGGVAVTTGPLTRGAGGYWSATVPGVTPGQLYRFRITGSSILGGHRRVPR